MLFSVGITPSTDSGTTALTTVDRMDGVLDREKADANPFAGELGSNA